LRLWPFSIGAERWSIDKMVEVHSGEDDLYRNGGREATEALLQVARAFRL